MIEQTYSATVVHMTNGTVEMRIGRQINSVEAYLNACSDNEIAAGRDGGAQFDLVANGITRDQVDASLLAKCAEYGCTHVRPAGKPAWAV